MPDIVLFIVDTVDLDLRCIVSLRNRERIGGFTVGFDIHPVNVREIQVVKFKFFTHICKILCSAFIELSLCIGNDNKLRPFVKYPTVCMDLDTGRFIHRIQSRRLHNRRLDLHGAVVLSEAGPVKLHQNRLCSQFVRNRLHNRDEYLKRYVFSGGLFHKLDSYQLGIRIVRAVMLVHHIVPVDILLCRKNLGINQRTVNTAVCAERITRIVILQILQIAKLIVYCQSHKLDRKVILSADDLQPNIMVDRVIGHRIHRWIGSLKHIRLQSIFAVFQCIRIRIQYGLLHQGVDGIFQSADIHRLEKRGQRTYVRGIFHALPNGLEAFPGLCGPIALLQSSSLRIQVLVPCRIVHRNQRFLRRSQLADRLLDFVLVSGSVMIHGNSAPQRL